MSKVMVIMWLVGDLTKLLFYVMQSQPIQFVFCATFQSTFDMLILGQFLMFGEAKPEDKSEAEVQEA